MQLNYVYRHIRLDTYEPFYIGIGKYQNNTNLEVYTGIYDPS